MFQDVQVCAVVHQASKCASSVPPLWAKEFLRFLLLILLLLPLLLLSRPCQEKGDTFFALPLKEKTLQQALRNDFT